MPFGLRNAPLSFQRIMIETSSDKECVLVYLDDLLIFSNSYKTHLMDKTRVLERLKEKNIMINMKKCTFCMKEAHFLGQIVSCTGVKADIGDMGCWDPKSILFHLKYLI